MPTPAQVLKGSAIGAQMVLHHHNGESEGEFQADFILSPGCGTIQPITIDVLSLRKTFRRDWLEFSLVCDPNYRTRVKSRPWLPIQIGLAEDVLNGPLSTYDLDWAVALSELPPNEVKMTISSSTLERLARNQNKLASESNDPREGIRFVFGVQQVNAEGGPTRHHMDKKWSLELNTAPGSNLLTIDEICKIPYWCANCHDELVAQAYVCGSCQVTRCWQCNLHTPWAHPSRHQIKQVILDKEKADRL